MRRPSSVMPGDHGTDRRIEGIEVTYIYSACVITETPDIRVLHDPWFTEGVYDGSWFQFPRIDDPIHSIGDVDAIFVSHIHPDHYDSAFLKSYFEVYGPKQVFIADHKTNHMARKMATDEIVPTLLQGALVIGKTTIDILPHETGSLSDIDSAFVLKFETSERTHCVVNVNDIIFNADIAGRIKQKAGEIDILMCGYTGAGPYPQTYFNVDDPDLTFESAKKKKAFFDRYTCWTSILQAKVNLPFAGKYLLGGKLAPLNPFRGVADAVEVLDFDPNAIVLADHGGRIDTATLIPSAIRTAPYDNRDIARRSAEISTAQMAYERLIPVDEIHQLPIKRLLTIAARNAVRKSECDEDYYFCFQLGTDEIAIINVNRTSNGVILFAGKGDELPTPRSEIEIDPRYLFGLLTHLYHWNNAEVGSQFFTRRYPNSYNRKAQASLNFLTV